MSAARLAYWAFAVGAAAILGCQPDSSAPPTEPLVNNTRQAADLADAYCKAHDLYWGRPMLIMRELDGYYVEYGGGRSHNGLVVGYDGVVHP
jgi:hypothetical protein